MAVRDYIAKTARHRPQPAERHLLRRGEAGGGQQDPGRPRPEPPGRDPHPRVAKRRLRVARTRARGGSRAAARGRARVAPRTLGHLAGNAGTPLAVSFPEVMGLHERAVRTAATDPEPTRRSSWPGPAGGSRGLRGGRAALPAPGVRRGPAHRAAHDVADDVAQEAFVRAWRSLDRFELGRPFGPWVCRIAANLAVNHVRSPRAREEGLPEGHAETPVLGARPARGRPRRGGAAGARRGGRASCRAEQRAVFVLRAVEELSYEEIAEALGISPGTVMSRLFRARERLARSPRAVSRGRGAAAEGGGVVSGHERERLSAYLDGELAAAERAAVEAHLAACAECAALLADLAAVDARGRRAARRRPRTATSRRFPSRVVARLGAAPATRARPRRPPGLDLGRGGGAAARGGDAADAARAAGAGAAPFPRCDAGPRRRRELDAPEAAEPKPASDARAAAAPASPPPSAPSPTGARPRRAAHRAARRRHGPGGQGGKHARRGLRRPRRETAAARPRRGRRGRRRSGRRRAAERGAQEPAPLPTRGASAARREVPPAPARRAAVARRGVGGVARRPPGRRGDRRAPRPPTERGGARSGGSRPSRPPHGRGVATPARRVARVRGAPTPTTPAPTRRGSGRSRPSREAWLAGGAEATTRRSFRGTRAAYLARRGRRARRTRVARLLPRLRRP